MKKLELFILGCKAERWKWRSWRISLFSVAELPLAGNVVDLEVEFSPHEPEPYDINYLEDGAYWYNGETKEWEKVEDSVPGEPLYDNRGLAKFPADSIPNHPEPIETTYGRMLFNWLVMVYAFGTKLPFQEKTTSKAIVKLFCERVLDDDETPPDDKTYFTASEVQRFVKAMYELPSLCQYITPTGTEKTLTTHPDMIKRRTELLEQYKDNLTPANIAAIQNELIALDKEWLKDDEAMDYYLSGKAFSVKRKKMFVMHGIEASFQEDGQFTLIPTSLNEGGDLTNMVAKNNSIREGSYDRGADTAKGGEKVTFLQRVYQNTKIIPGDCGTKLTYKFMITAQNAHAYYGLNMVVGTKLVVLTPEIAKENFGKVIAIRRPLLCRASHTDYCECCTGPSLAKSPRGVASEIAAVGSDIMYAFMQSMHGTELSVAHFDFNIHLN